jgi:hypothetical protein
MLPLNLPNSAPLAMARAVEIGLVIALIALAINTSFVSYVIIVALLFYYLII